MTISPLRRNETHLITIVDRIRQLMEGRRNAHGEADVDNDGVATSTTVTATTCAAASNVTITPLNAAAAALTGVYVVPDDGSFDIFHPATTTAATFRWSVNG